MTENVSSSISSVQPRPIAAAARGRWLRRLMLAVIFLSGLMAGVGVTLLAVRQGVLYGIHHPEEMPERVAARLRRPLNLSDQQADRVEAIIQQRQTHLQEIRRRFQPEVEAELEQVYAEIRELLDDQQRERWEQIYTHLRQTWIPLLPKPAELPGRSD